MQRVEFGGGVAMAVFAAGPAFVLVAVFATLIFDTPQSEDIAMLTMGMLSMTLIAIPFGIAISLIPNLIGGLVMASLGVHYPAARRRRVWAIAGALLAMLILALFAAPGPPEMLPVFGLFAITGAICALIVRYGTRWSDDASV